MSKAAERDVRAAPTTGDRFVPSVTAYDPEGDGGCVETPRTVTTPQGRLEVRPLSKSEVSSVVDYFLNASDADVERMGLIERAKLPTRDQWLKRLDAQLRLPDSSASAFYWAWLVDGKAIGFSSLKNLKRGQSADIHLHVWSDKHRGKGNGAALFCLSVLATFDRFRLQELVCEPKADNAMPNRMLTKIGYKVEKTYEGSASDLSRVAPLNRYVIDRATAERYLERFEGPKANAPHAKITAALAAKPEASRLGAPLPDTTPSGRSLWPTTSSSGGRPFAASTRGPVGESEKTSRANDAKADKLRAAPATSTEAPTLQGKHVLLEPLEERHAAELWLQGNETGLWDHMTYDVRTLDDLRAWIRNRIAGRDAGTAYPFVIRDAQGRAVGSTSIFDISIHKTMEVGHTWLGASARRTAINSECKRLVLGYCFETLGAIRVQLKCDERNERSRKALERLGATYEGTTRNQMVLSDGHRRNARIYAILDTEWPAVRDRLDAGLNPK